MNLQSSTVVFKGVKLFEDSTVEFEFKDEKSVKFMVGAENSMLYQKNCCTLPTVAILRIYILHIRKKRKL